MTRNDYEQHGLEYYESKRERKENDGAKKISVQPESGVKMWFITCQKIIWSYLGWHQFEGW